VLATAPAVVEPKEVPEQYTWNLTDLYADTAAWEAARVALGSEIRSPGAGRASSVNRRARCSRRSSTVRTPRCRRPAPQLRLADERPGHACLAYMEMQQQSDQVYTDFKTATAYYRPRSCRSPRQDRQFLAQERSSASTG